MPWISDVLRVLLLMLAGPPLMSAGAFHPLAAGCQSSVFHVTASHAAALTLLYVADQFTVSEWVCSVFWDVKLRFGFRL